MHRLLLIAVLSTIASFPLSLEAQFRCDGHRGGFPSRAGTVVVTGCAPRVVFGRNFEVPTVVSPRRYFNVPRAGAPYALQPAPFFEPFVYAPPIYTAPPYISVQQAPPTNAGQVNELSYQVQRLTRKIQRLRDEQRLRDARRAPLEPPPSTETPSVSTILVFRDGHRIEVQGYAIVGQTLWALTEQISTQISISDLDLETTQKENAERGVRFPLPRQR